MVLAIKSNVNHNVSIKAGFANYFAKLFVHFKKSGLISKTTPNTVGFFRYFCSLFVDLQFCQVEFILLFTFPTAKGRNLGQQIIILRISRSTTSLRKTRSFSNSLGDKSTFLKSAYSFEK